MDDENRMNPTRRDVWKGAAPLAAAAAAALVTPLSSLLAPADPPGAVTENGCDGLPPAASPGTPRLPAEACAGVVARTPPLAGTR